MVSKPLVTEVPDGNDFFVDTAEQGRSFSVNPVISCIKELEVAGVNIVSRYDQPRALLTPKFCIPALRTTVPLAGNIRVLKGLYFSPERPPKLLEIMCAITGFPNTFAFARLHPKSTKGDKFMAFPDVATPDIAEVAIPSPLAERTDRDGKPIGNLMLQAIPDEEFGMLRPLLEPLDLPRYRVLYEQGEKIVHAYFLNQGMISLVVIAKDGRTVEVGIAGRAGVVGVPLAFGLDDAFSRAIVQLPGNGLRIAATFLPETFDHCPTLRRMIERYVLTQQLQVAQIAACNRLHDMDQRLARWLLMCQDTIDSGMIPLTHEFIAQMLGSGRPTVTIAAGVLERAGLIENTRGNVKIVNRKRLEDAACECYGAIQNFNTSLALS